MPKIGFRCTPLELPFHESPAFSRDARRKTLDDSSAKTGDRILAAS
jgi:hypothetical protein